MSFSTKEWRLSREAWFVVSASLLCAAVWTVLVQPGYWEAPRLVAPALAIDLSLGLPLLGYFFLVRGLEKRGWMLVPLFALGLALARWWIPRAHQDLSTGFGIVAIASELVVMAYLAVRVGRVAREYRRLRGLDRSRADATRHALARVLGRRLGGAIFTEVSALWYATRIRQREPRSSPTARLFSGHRRNGYAAILGVFLFLIVLESSITHLLLWFWHPAVAWWATAFGLYSVLWLLGDYHAARLNPASASADALVLNTGLRWHATLPWPEIVAIHDRSPEGQAQRMTLLGAPDFWLETREPVRVAGPFGIERTVRYLGVGVDAPAELRALIAERISPTATSTS
jgi:hypothetical protein